MPTISKIIVPDNLQVVVGLGKTGLSCVRYLYNTYANIAVTDSRNGPPYLEEMKKYYPDVPLYLGQLDSALCSKASRLIVSPGVSLQEPAIMAAISQGVPVVGDIELFSREAKAPIIAITGSNGKSSVTTLVANMASKAGRSVRAGANLSTPALDLLSENGPDLYVLELSSFQLETTDSLKAQAAVLLNLSEDHMDRYNTLADYLKAKQRIYNHAIVPVVNRDAPDVWENLSLKNTLSFGLSSPPGDHFGLESVDEILYLVKGKQKLIKASELKIKGRHQLSNALAALALGTAAGLEMAPMLEALAEFPGLPHRCQWVANYGGVDWYNDSKATNVGATQAALEGLGQDISGKFILIAGGLGKQADFSQLRGVVKRYVRHLILIGKDAPLIAEALYGFVTMHHADTLERAVFKASAISQVGDVVILAPACASFDMFKNFEDRGNVFMEAVRNLV